MRIKAAQAALAETSPKAAEGAAGQTCPEQHIQSLVEETRPADAPAVFLLLLMPMANTE